MVEVLRELFGEMVTKEAAEVFMAELNRRYVRKDAYDSRQTEAAALQEQLAAAQQKAGDVEALRAQLEEVKLLAAVDAALRKAGAKNEVAVRALLDMDQIAFVDGVLTGLEEQIARLKATDGYLFAEEKPRFGSYSKGGFARRTGGMPTKEELAGMTYSQMMEAKRKYPNLEI